MSLQTVLPEDYTHTDNLRQVMTCLLGSNHLQCQGVFLITFPIFLSLAFKPHVQSCGFLSPYVKKTLRKLSWNRTDEEIEVVLQVVKKLKCFDRYPMYVKRELAKVLYYDMFETGRVVIKQGMLHCTVRLRLTNRSSETVQLPIEHNNVIEL